MNDDAKQEANTNTAYDRIPEFDIVGDKPENALPGNTPRDLEQVEFRFIQARRVKAYTGCELDPCGTSPTDKITLAGDSDKASREPTDAWKEPNKQHERNLVGLAFSGGGIRSATFGLGVLQGLADLQLLKNFDYLSTVSGGGYIGSWLASWIKREGDVENVEQQLKPDRVEQAQAFRGFGKEALTQGLIGKGEPEPIFHLREFSNYLSPRLSFFSADSWTLIAIYLRNLLANQLVLLPLVVTVLLLTRIYVFCLQLPHHWLPPTTIGTIAFAVAALLWTIIPRFTFPKLVMTCGIVSVLEIGRAHV